MTFIISMYMCVAIQSVLFSALSHRVGVLKMSCIIHQGYHNKRKKDRQMRRKTERGTVTEKQKRAAARDFFMPTFKSLVTGATAVDGPRL